MAEDDEPFLPPQIQQHARAIGYLCIFWAALEHEIDTFLDALIPLEAGQVSDSVVANIDFREKLRILLALGFIRKPNAGWFRRLERTVNHVDNGLRPERNRFVHDQWRGLDPIVRRTKRTALVRPQARQIELRAFEDRAIKPAEIWRLVNSVASAQVALKILEIGYRDELRKAQPKSVVQPPEGQSPQEHHPG